MIRLIDFSADHAEELFTKNTTLATADSKYTLRHWLDRMEKKDRAFTLIDNGHLVVAGGIFPIWNGMGEAWLIPSDNIPKYKLKIIKTLRNHIDTITAEDDLHRLQATVRDDFDIAKRFIEFLGFEREGTLKNYGPDKTDHIMYSRT